ncbi:MAG: c-type cytochrome [Verrucomicrobiota bacterium]
MKKNSIAVLVVFTAMRLALSAPLKIELPIETALYKPANGADLANAQCLTCHSAEYVSTHPPMPRAFWKGAVDKMIEKYGAPVPTEQIEDLADYLAQNYGTESTNKVINPLSAKEIPASATSDAKQLMQKGGCFNCHMIDRKFIGPSFKDVAGKYEGNPEAISRISRQITQGGSGLWGSIPMPPFPQIPEGDVKVLAEWILTQR